MVRCVSSGSAAVRCGGGVRGRLVPGALAAAGACGATPGREPRPRAEQRAVGAHGVGCSLPRGVTKTWGAMAPTPRDLSRGGTAARSLAHAALVELDELPGHARPGELRFDSLTSRRTHADAEVGIQQEAHDCIGQ